jgi:TonB family protein
MIGCRAALGVAAFACLFLPRGGVSPRCTLSTESVRSAEIAARVPVTISSRITVAQAGNQIQVWFKGVSLSEFLQTVSPVLGIIPLLVDPDVQGAVTIDPAVRISREELRVRFDWILFENQAMLRKSGANYRVSRRPVPGATESAGAKPPQREPVRVPATEQQTRLITRVEPVYPDLALKARVSGTSLLQVTVDEQGDVSLVRIVRSGHPLVQRSVLEAVEQWHYLPACIDGETVPVISTVSVTFNLAFPALSAEAPKAAQPASESPARAPVRVERNQQSARLVYRVEPEYPETARKEHLAGTVWLDVNVDGSGQVSAVRFLCGPQSVEQAVADAVRQWRYVPAETGGSAVSVVTLVSFPVDLRER